MAKKKFKIKHLLRPTGWILGIIYVVTLFSIIISLLLQTVDLKNEIFTLFTHILYSVAAVGLCYSIYTLVIYFSTIKKIISNRIKRNRFANRMINNFGYRTFISAIGSCLLNIAYGTFHLILAVVSKSIWNGLLTCYYFLLTFLRMGILLYQKKRYRNGDNPYGGLKTYRTCGILLVILNTVLFATVTQVIFENKTFYYGSILIYGTAAYSFIKMSFAIVNIIRAKKSQDITIRAIRNINLVDAAVSIFALQTALFSTFPSDDLNATQFNAFTGIAVCLFALFVGIFMIRISNKKLKRINGLYGKQEI